MSEFFHLTIELLFGFVGLLIAVKIIGKRHVQQVSPFDFISAVVLGELLGNALYIEETTIFHIFYAISLWTLLLYMIEKIAQKSHKVRNVIEGSPVLIIKKGVIDFQVLKKEKLDFTELMSLLRDKDVFSVREIEYAIVEPSGVITVIKKTPYAQVVKSDVSPDTQPASINLPLVLDGNIDYHNLHLLGFDAYWLRQNLSQQGISDEKQVLFAEWNEKDGLYTQKKDENVPPIR